MSKWKRKIIFWFLVVSFLITAPLIVFRAKGYRFDINRGVFVYSGAITFKVNPSSINIKLNNKSASYRKLNILNGAYNIAGLIPKYYNLQISANDFKTWSKKIAVHSGVDSEFWNVLLAKNHYKKTALHSLGTNAFFISPNNHFIASAINSKQILALKILNLASPSKNVSLTFPQWNFIKKDNGENIEWSPDETYISIPVKKTFTSFVKTNNSNSSNPLNTTPVKTKKNKPKNNYFIYDLNSQTSFNLNKFLSKQHISHIRWDPLNKNYLFFLKHNNLYRVNIKDNHSLVKIASSISSYDVSKNGIYYVKIPTNLIFNVSLDGKSKPTQITDSFPNSKNTTISKIIVYDNSRIALISKDNNLYIFNQGDHHNYFKKLKANIKGIQFSNDGKKLLIWSKYEIFVYYLRDWNVQPIRAENEIQNITRYSEIISNVQWFKDYEHIIFNVGPQIKIIELDPRDHRNCMDITSVKIQKPFIVYDGYLKRLYFTDVSNATTDLYSITFPEKTAFINLKDMRI